jgi:hypothetical protein
MAATDLVKTTRGLAIFDKATSTPVLGALSIARQLRGVVPYATSFVNCPVPLAIERRTAWLPYFAAADEAACMLYRALTTPIEHTVAATMIGHVYSALGIKPKRPMLEAVLDLVFGDDVARATGWAMSRMPDGEPGASWEPLNATPLTVALGCRMLISSARFEPKPSELRQAIRDARLQVTLAQGEAARSRDAVIELDAILLQKAHDDWERPYVTAQYRPLLPRILDLHNVGIDDDDDEPSDFQKLVAAERAKLALPKAEPVAIAACAQPTPKRTHKRRKPRAAVEPPA